MNRKKQKQTNYRMSEGAIKLVEEAAGKSGLTKTEVIEACITKYAAGIPELAGEARRVLFEVVAGELAKLKPSSARTESQTGQGAQGAPTLEAGDFLKAELDSVQKTPQLKPKPNQGRQQS